MGDRLHPTGEGILDPAGIFGLIINLWSVSACGRSARWAGSRKPLEESHWRKSDNLGRATYGPLSGVLAR